VEYETEEQQVEALKAWWAENGRAVIAGVVLGVAVIGGWTFWQDRQERRALAASDAYGEALIAVDADDGARVAELADLLAEEHEGSLYAAFANLAAARLAIAGGDLESAAERLAWAAEHAPQEDVQLVATVRLARVEGALGRVDDGLARLPESYAETFTGLVEEARGDLLVQSGDLEAARTAYESAQASGDVADAAALGMKLDDLAVAESTS